MAGIITPFAYRGFTTATGYVEIYNVTGGPNNERSEDNPTGVWTGFLRYYASKEVRDAGVDGVNNNVETDTNYGVIQCPYQAGEDPFELLLTKLHNEWFPGGTIV